MRQRGMGHPQHRLEVEVDHPVPVLGVAVRHGAAGAESGVVHQEVQPPEVVHGLIDRPACLGGGGEVGGHGQGHAALCADLLRQLLQASGAAGHQREEHPCWASARAVAAPMPLEAPVTSATLPVSGLRSAPPPARRRSAVPSRRARSLRCPSRPAPPARIPRPGWPHTRSGNPYPVAPQNSLPLWYPNSSSAPQGKPDGREIRTGISPDAVRTAGHRV